MIQTQVIRGEDQLVEQNVQEHAGGDDWSFDRFRAGTTTLPSPNLAWNTYGKGVENVGVEGRPEAVEIPPTGPNQLLIRVDAVGHTLSIGSKAGIIDAAGITLKAAALPRK